MLAALLLKAYIIFRKGVKTFRWLCLEKELPAFMKSHFSLEEKKRFFISMGVSKLCRIKGEQRLVDYVYNTRVNI